MMLTHRRVRCAGHVARVGEITNEYKIFHRKTGRSDSISETYAKVGQSFLDVKETAHEGLDWVRVVRR
jgi:hypothetical protein